MTAFESLQVSSRELLECIYCVTERQRQRRSDCGGAVSVKRYAVQNLTVSRKTNFLPEKHPEFRGELCIEESRARTGVGVANGSLERTHARTGG